MSALICGSFAYDTIMVFEGRFKNHILPDKVHILNVSFLVPDLRREFGGCAGNIAYNLQLLDGDPLPMGTVGEDFEPYADWMDECGVSRGHVRLVPGSYTAQAFITTDQDDNQITAFHPGAMNHAQNNSVRDAEGVTIGIVSPDGRAGMLKHAQEFAELDIPFVFDPGQGLPMFDGKELEAFIEQATWLAMNDYEAEMLSEKTGLSRKQISARVKAMIVTRGGKGSVAYADGKELEIPVARISGVKDPTGCGDAYRAGLLYGLINNMDLETTLRVASLMGAIKIEHAGTQRHLFSREEFRERFKESFDFLLD
ncbi:MAG: carbohydrate kinase family protein [Gammaproteobacteria bacterium]|nr:MAG: carbohydrate kinase family protein [Gammaproteobacteria bacterium]